MPQVKYEQLDQYQYVADNDGQTEIVIPDLAGCRIVQIKRNIIPITDFTWNKNTAKLVLTNGLIKEEILFILYAKIVVQ
jgi:hypothetical protein